MGEALTNTPLTMVLTYYQQPSGDAGGQVCDVDGRRWADRQAVGEDGGFRSSTSWSIALAEVRADPPGRCT